jgi:hypothetical protein
VTKFQIKAKSKPISSFSIKMRPYKIPSLLFATFSMKKNNLKFKTVKVEGFHPRSHLRSAATPQYPSKLKN